MDFSLAQASASCPDFRASLFDQSPSPETVMALVAQLGLLALLVHAALATPRLHARLRRMPYATGAAGNRGMSRPGVRRTPAAGVCSFVCFWEVRSAMNGTLNPCTKVQVNPGTDQTMGMTTGSAQVPAIGANTRGGKGGRSLTDHGLSFVSSAARQTTAAEALALQNLFKVQEAAWTCWSHC